MPRLLVILFVFLLALVVGAALLLPRLFDEEELLALAASTLEEQTGAILTVSGDTQLSLFPTLGLKMSQAAIALPGDSPTGAEVESLQVGVKLMALLSGRLEIEAFRLEGLTVQIHTAAAPTLDTETLSDAQLDAFYSKRRQTLAEAGKAAAGEAVVAAPLALRVGRLDIRNARLQLIDPEGAATVIQLAALTASDLNLDNRPIPLELEATVPGEQPITVVLQSLVSINQQNQMATLGNLNLTLTGATALPLTVNGTGTIGLAKQIADITISLTLGDTRGEGKLRYASFESPQIDAKLQFNQFDPALVALAGPQAAQSDATAADQSGEEPLPLGALRGIDTLAELGIATLRIAPHEIHDATLTLRAKDGLIELKNITGELHGGQLQARASFNARHNIASLTTSGRIDTLDIAKAVVAAQGGVDISGMANLGWQLSGKGKTADALTKSLHGPIKLDTQKVVLTGTSVEHLLCQAVALTNRESLTSTFPNNTHFETLRADVQVTNGQAKLQPLTASLAGVSLNGSGYFDLLEQSFDTTFKARLSPKLEKLDNACRVSKRLTAIDWPVNCKGSVADGPASWCKVDSEKIIKDIATGEGRRQLEKKASKLLNKFFNQSD